MHHAMCGRFERDLRINRCIQPLQHLAGEEVVDMTKDSVGTSGGYVVVRTCRHGRELVCFDTDPAFLR